MHTGRLKEGIYKVVAVYLLKVKILVSTESIKDYQKNVPSSKWVHIPVLSMYDTTVCGLWFPCYCLHVCYVNAWWINIASWSNEYAKIVLMHCYICRCRVLFFPGLFSMLTSIFSPWNWLARVIFLVSWTLHLIAFRLFNCYSFCYASYIV